MNNPAALAGNIIITMKITKGVPVFTLGLLSFLHHNTFRMSEVKEATWSYLLLLFTALCFFRPCVLIKDTYCANYSSQPAIRHIFSLPVRSQTPPDQEGACMGSLLQQSSLVPPREAENDLYGGQFGSAWLNPKRFTLIPEVWQTNIRLRYKWLYTAVWEKATAHRWATSTFRTYLDLPSSF